MSQKKMSSKSQWAMMYPDWCQPLMSLLSKAKLHDKNLLIVILCHFLFQILNPTCISSAFPLSSISNLECQDVKCTLSDSTIALTLRWVATNSRVDPIEHCNIYCSSMIGNRQDKETTWKSDYVFIGRAYASCFRVTNLYMLSPNLEESPFSIEFRVQPVSCSRRKPRVEESECLLVEVNP